MRDIAAICAAFAAVAMIPLDEAKPIPRDRWVAERSEAKQKLDAGRTLETWVKRRRDRIWMR